MTLIFSTFIFHLSVRNNCIFPEYFTEKQPLFTTCYPHTSSPPLLPPCSLLFISLLHSCPPSPTHILQASSNLALPPLICTWEPCFRHPRTLIRPFSAFQQAAMLIIRSPFSHTYLCMHKHTHFRRHAGLCRLTHLWIILCVDDGKMSCVCMCGCVWVILALNYST